MAKSMSGDGAILRTRHQSATLLFSGLTPTSVGLYQINATVPAAGPGLKAISISVGGVSSKPSNILIQ